MQVIFNMLYRGISNKRIYCVALANITYNNNTSSTSIEPTEQDYFSFLGQWEPELAVASFHSTIKQISSFIILKSWETFQSYGNFRIIDQLNMEDFSHNKLYYAMYSQIDKQARMKSF